MFKTIIAIIVSAFATFIAAAEPFLVFEGNESSAPKQPQACISSTGTVHLTFGVGQQVYYCRVDGDKCSAAQVAFQIPNMSLGMRRGPRIAHSGKAIVVTAIGGAQGRGRDGDILSYRSLDDGKTWLGPVKVNDVEASGREGLHAMTASEEGTLWCVWLDLREKGTKLFASKSEDHGATWSKNNLIYRSPDGSICECCHPSIVVSKKNVHVLFRNSLQGNRDMYLVSSDDQGTTFGNAVRLGRDSWRLNACPMDGGMLVTNNNGDLATVWRRDRSVITTSAKSGYETLLGAGEQPWVGSDGSKFYTAWTSKREGELLLASSDDVSPVKLSEEASFPIVIGGSQTKPTVYVFWEARRHQTATIVGQRVR